MIKPAFSSARFVAECVGSETYSSYCAEVDALQTQATQANIFVDPGVMNAANENSQIFLVWREEGAVRQLIAAWPLSRSGRNVLTPRLHEYMMLSAPLVHSNYLEEGWLSLLEAIACKKTLPGIIHCPFIPEGDIFTVLQKALRASKMPFAVVAKEKRGFLTAQINSEGFFATQVSGKARRNMSAQRSRLEKLGRLSYEVFSGKRAYEKLDDFLALEAKSWKGRRGTAIASRHKDRNFITTCFKNLSADKAFISALMLNGIPIAMGLVFRSFGHAWFLKTAYDEKLSSLSPGVHYAKTLAEEFLRDPEFYESDSCARLGLGRHVMFWNTPRFFYNLLIRTSGQRNFSFAALAMAMKTKEYLRAIKRRWL
jgi:hypothetical protein